MKYQLLVIHCSDTPPAMVVSKEILSEWHKSPRDDPDGTVTYLEKNYPNRAALPNDFFNGKSIKSLSGRGWSRLGYRDIIHREGVIENITPFVDDDIITNDEVTWGAVGVNLKSVHVCMEGGRLAYPYIQPPLKGAEVILFTEVQLEVLLNYVLVECANHPQIRVAGHSQLTNQKNCPNFDVTEWLKKINREDFAYRP